MIKKVRHTGIVVSDLKKMSKFYESLGFVEFSSEIETGHFIDSVVNIANVKVEWIKMKSPDGFLLELLQYHSHPMPLNSEAFKSNDLGCSHLAYTVNDINNLCEKIVAGGGSITNKPVISPNGKVKVAYCNDPEGVLIELVEELT